MLVPKAVLLAAGVFAGMVLLFRYVSLGSIVAVALFPFLAWWLHDYGGGWPVWGSMVAAATLILIKHHENIRRLTLGTEPRFQWRAVEPDSHHRGGRMGNQSGRDSWPQRQS